jgi:hypothetical protein
MNWADIAMKGFALLGMVWVAWLVGKHGFGWVASKVTGAGAAVRADILSLEARVKAIEAHPALAIPALPVVVGVTGGAK